MGLVMYSCGQIVLIVASRIFAKGEQNASHYLSGHETSQGIRFKL